MRSEQQFRVEGRVICLDVVGPEGPEASLRKTGRLLFDPAPGVTTQQVASYLNLNVERVAYEDVTAQGKQSRGMTDEPKPLTEEEVEAIDKRAEADMFRVMGAEPLGSDPVVAARRTVARDARRLVVEISRLHQLAVDTYPYVPDTEQTQPLHLMERLKAEVDR